MDSRDNHRIFSSSVEQIFLIFDCVKNVHSGFIDGHSTVSIALLISTSTVFLDEVNLT